MPKTRLRDRLQKWLSSLLIFVIFASQTIHIPLGVPDTLAAGSTSPSLVSIIVSESTNSGSMKSRIKRYASDIQGAMTNTRVTIIEVPENAAPPAIAAANERLYYQGDGDGISRLVGTVLIGKLPIPVVHKGVKTFLSIYPYTDFDDKVFVFDAAKGYYDSVSTPVTRDTPEIWHGVIQPNTGSAEGDAAKLGEFLDKTHAYYTKSGAFSETSAEPSVIYLDLLHDQAATKPQDFKAYNLYIRTLEDLSYNRYNKYLAKQLYSTYQSFQDPLADTNPEELAALGVKIPDIQSMDFASVPDIQTRTAILKTVKQFFEIFNDKYIGDILKFVNNTGRYGDGKNTRVDIAPVLISKRDEFMKRVLKDGNTTVEGMIDEVVKSGLARDVLIPINVSIVNAGMGNRGSSQNFNPYVTAPNYNNYYYGQSATGINSARDCSIVRGTTLKVEANRGYDTSTIQGDAGILSANPALCFSGESANTLDFWGGNSGLSLKTTDLTPGEIARLSTATSPADFVGFEGRLGTKFSLPGNRYKDYVLPTLNLRGQNETSLPVSSPADCLNENFIADPYTYTEPEEEFRAPRIFYHPASTRGTAFACVMRDSNGALGHKTLTERAAPVFAQVMDPGFRPPACTIYEVTLEGRPTKTVGALCTETTGSGEDAQTSTYGITYKYSYKKVPSYIEHKSPNSEEYGAALKAMTTPSLASDRDRYIDFLTPAGTVAKIEYPNFYRMTWGDTENLTPDMVRARIKEVLDAKTKEISALITANNPAGLTGAKLIEYNELKRGDYPGEGVDLYTRLASAGNALSTLVDTILWYNESNATNKYAFVLENYLDRDGNRDYPLSGMKKDYELAYIGGNGDAQNMYVKVDPEAKVAPPKEITDIQAEYGSLTNLLAGSNITSYGGEGAQFKCGPPEGVPIWQWLPAVFCWLGTILPPTIGAGSCGNQTLGAKSAADAQFFTSQTGADGKPDWQADRNNNGILDGYEWVKDGKLLLTASPKRLGYLATTKLEATLIKNDRTLAFDSYNQVQFDVKRIILKAGQILPASSTGGLLDQTPLATDRVVYARGATGENGSIDTLKRYLTFTPLAVRAENGVAGYTLGSKSKDLDVFLEASVSPLDKNNSPAFLKTSDEALIEIRNQGLRVTPLTQIEWGTRADSTFDAGVAQNIVYSFAVTKGDGVAPEIDTTAVKRPINVTLYDDVDGRVIEWPTKITTDTYKYSGELLKQAGSYRFEFTDDTGRLGVSSLTILPARAVTINAIASSSIFVKGQKSTILVRAVDAFGNIARWNVLKFQGKIAGGGYFASNSDTKLEKSTIEGTTSFEVSSNSGGQTHKVTIEVDNWAGRKLSTDISLESIDAAKIRVSVDDRDRIIAGGDKKKVSLEVTTTSGEVLTKFSGIASLDFPRNSGSFSRAFVQIRDGKNLDPIEFTPGTLAVQNASIDVQIPGIREVTGGTLTILPNAPMRVGLTSGVATLEARTGNETEILATLYDRFGNLAYNHPSGMTAAFAIPSGYAKYGSIDATGGFTNGVAKSKLRTTKKPGTLYYTVAVSPGLEANTFSITDKSWATLTIKGYSRNAAMVETYYLWNAEKLKNTNYNALSTTLLGADYWNVTVPNYLGGEILFAPDSRSLSVTTLLNSAKKSADLVSMTPAGKITLANGGLARIDVGSARGRTTLGVFDPFRRENIGQFTLALGDSTPLLSCGSADQASLDNCSVGTNQSYILLKGIGKSEVKKGNTLSLTMDGVSVFDIAPNGVIRKYPGIELRVEGRETKNFLSIGIYSNNVAVGQIAIRMSGDSIVRTNADSAGAAITANPGSILYEPASPRYAAKSNFLGNSSFGSRGLTISQVEDAPKWVDRDLVGSSGKVGLEQYADLKGIGFWNGNNTLLEFAGQASVGEASRAAATYSMIVLGDPVARLPELASWQNYDRTLGKRLTDGMGGAIESSATLDYNKDGQEDIAVFYDDGKVELLQNFDGTYRSLGYVVYVVDAGPERKVAGDFAGGGYGSIVMVDTKWWLIVLENQKGKFVRIPTRLKQLDGTDTKIQGAIMQLETFDMDKDGRLDLIISDDSGELNILYWSTDATGLYFTRKNLDKNIGLKLGGGVLSTGGALRWDGIREIQAAPTQTDYVRESTASDANEGTLSAADQKRLLDSKIYYMQTTTRTVASPAAARSERLTRALGDDPNNPGTPNAALAEQINTAITTTTALGAAGSINTQALDNTTLEDRKTYIRSEFAEGEDLKVERSFTDKNGGTLQAWDRIEVSIKIANLGSVARTNMSYLDSYDRGVFKPSENTRLTMEWGATSSGTLLPLTDGIFDYQFNGLTLAAKNSLTLKYELIANAVRYGKFKVGVLETDDPYGDVSMNANAVCGDEEILWKSVDPRPRSYLRTIKTITKLQDPNSTKEGKFTDFNGNGQSDYIDLLSWAGGPNEIKSTLWDPTKNGILVFRESPSNGVIDGKSFQIGRLVLDGTKGFVQSNPVSLSGDIPLLPPESMTGCKAERPNAIHSGEIPADGDIPPACTKPENVAEMSIRGFEQGFKIEDLSDITGRFRFVAIGKDTTTGQDCSINITEVSNPTSDGTNVTGIGWKLLTKSTFGHFGMAGTQADLINSSAGIPDTEEPRGGDTIRYSTAWGLQGTVDISGMSSVNVDRINAWIDTIVQGLGCGFGGGSCLALPMNWAPLAPGSAPVILGNPISPLTVDSGRPVFSMLNFRKIWRFCIPLPYPAASGGPGCIGESPGGSLGTWSPANYFRFFVTPTLTGAVGIAACYGGPAKAVGNLPPRGVSPLVPGGNCIVAAKPLNACTDDGSDGNIADLGSLDASGTVNAAACRNPLGGNDRDQYPLLGVSEQRAIASYVRSGGQNASFVSDILKNAAGRWGLRARPGPLLTLGSPGGQGDIFNVSIDPKAIKSFDRGMIEKIQHERVSAFPDFIMDWVNRQLEEVSNKITSLPTLYIIKPDFRGALDTQWSGFTDKLESSYKGWATNGEPVLGNTEAGRTISGVKAAYEFMSRIPLIRFEPSPINVTYPDINGEELSKMKKEYEATRDQWKREIDSKKKLYAATATADGLDKSVIVEAESLVSGIDENIRMIEAYKKFPDQLAKYLSWKERYARQLLCNVTAIQAILDAFITSNAAKFKAWVEFSELLKNILKGYQLIPDLFYKYDAECGVCRNERHDAKQFKFKLISAIIPPLPIIKFPKWPDIILDLHNVRMGLRIPMPEFSFTPTPLILPRLPNLSLPTIPKIGIGLPGILRLPALPPLPELPNLPSLPTIKLPELPPPPTIPKLFGSIKFTLNILKIVAKVMCLMRSNPFVPEWRAGDQIAQITERQGKLGIDFLNIEFPQFNASFVDAIKVTTFVNFEFQIDFLLEMARATFEPVSSFTANMTNVLSNPAGGIPGNIDLRWLNPGDQRIDLSNKIGLENSAKYLARAFISTVRSGQQAANSNAEFSELRDLLEMELAALIVPLGSDEAAIVQDMRAGLAYRADNEAALLAQTLKTDNAAKFKLATGFIESEIAETTAIQSRLAGVRAGTLSMREAITGEPSRDTSWANATLIDAETSISTASEVPDFSVYNSKLADAYLALDTPAWDPGVNAASAQLLERAERFSASIRSQQASFAAGESTQSSSMPAENIYRGIYLYDNARQIRLFDYTDDLAEGASAVKVNRRGNGATEYIYVVSGALYLKSKLGNSSTRPSTQSISTLSLKDLLGEVITPTAPNQFEERFAKSGEIQFDFAPSDPSQNLWALTLYDYIDRYTRLLGGESIARIEPTTRTTRVDLVPTLESELIESTTTKGLTVWKAFATYQSGRGEASMLGPDYRVLWSGEKIRMSAGKSLYSSSGGARIKYQYADIATPNTADGSLGIISLGEGRELRFETTMDIEILSGAGLLLTPNTSRTPRTVDLANLRGYPVFEWADISFDRPSTRLDIAYYNGTNVAMNGPTLYQVYGLGAKAKNYSVSLSHPNGWEYGSLVTINDKNPTRTQIRLLSPQIQADREGPLITLTQPLRAPVYLSGSLSFTQSITDSSGVKEVYIDEDLTQDRDGDGKKDNDRDSDTGAGVIRRGSGGLSVVISAQDKIGERPVKIWAIDEAGNTSSRESKLVIYAPIPTIKSQSGAVIQGALDEILERERVDIVRFRNGLIDPIGATLLTTASWAFTTTLGTGSGLVLKENGTPLASINERTGVVTLTGSGISLWVAGATSTEPMSISIERSGRVLYTQAIALSDRASIEGVQDIADARTRVKNGLAIIPEDTYQVVKNSPNATSLPAGVYITGADRKPVFGVARDGNVYLIETWARIEYGVDGGSLALKVKNSRGQLIATLFYVLNAEFVIK